MGRAVVVTFHGDDCRLYSVAAERFPARGRVTDAADEPRRRDRLERLARHAHGALVADLELAAYVAPWYPRIYVTPLPIRLAPVASTAAEKRSGRPVVVHAATDPRVKGTDAIQAAAAEVARRRPLEFRVLTGTSHAEVLAELRRADIVVDQLNSVTSGVFALEALALGLPVLGELDRRALPPYQSDLPVVPVTAETLAGKLEALLDDEGERARLGESGRAYVAATHAPEQVGRIALSIYRHAREAPPGTYEATSRGIVPLG
jgi:glycosyltransferase involved in cell wall biosynthesis